MKYSRLDKAQLQSLEKEFIDFLVVNGITADDWLTIKRDNREKAEAVIDQFSDVIWEGVLRKANHLEMYTPSSIYCFKCDPDQIHLLKLNDHRAVADLTDPNYRAQALDGSMHITIQSMSKAYQTSRELEIFHLIQSGCVLTEGALYAQLQDQ